MRLWGVAMDRRTAGAKMNKKCATERGAADQRTAEAKYVQKCATGEPRKAPQGPAEPRRAQQGLAEPRRAPQGPALRGARVLRPLNALISEL